LQKGIKVAGIDEVGKGSLFGPVFASAVVLTKSAELKLREEGLKDSKLLTSKKRADLVPKIRELSERWGLGQASAKEIDCIGIRRATEKAMIRALHRLGFEPNLVLVDGSLPLRGWNGKQKCLIKGESHSTAIAAASVLAKEARDELIKRLAARFPEYGLETNVGYGTKFHREMLHKLGHSSLHRKSFLSRII